MLSTFRLFSLLHERKSNAESIVSVESQSTESEPTTGVAGEPQTPESVTDSLSRPSPSPWSEKLKTG